MYLKTTGKKRKELGRGVLRNQSSVTLGSEVLCMVLDFIVHAPPFLDNDYTRCTRRARNVSVELLSFIKNRLRNEEKFIILTKKP